MKPLDIVHSLGNLSAQKSVNGNTGFLLTNKKGGYCSFFSVPDSRYQGLFFFESSSMSMYKVIESIMLRQNDISSIKNGFYSIERKKHEVVESFSMPRGYNSLAYELSREEEIDIILDCKNSFDNREWGRHYEIFEEEKCILVKFTKKTDKGEDGNDGKEEFSIYLAIKSDAGIFKKNDEWIERHYTFDEKRNSKPFRRFVYNALKLTGSKFVFSMSMEKDSAIRECIDVFSNVNKLKIREKSYFLQLLEKEKVKKILKSRASKETKIAFVAAANSLNNLVVAGNGGIGLFAGIPWFFQFWSRDTAISLKGLGMIDEDSAKSLAFGYLDLIGNDGRLPNLIGRHGSVSSGNADAHGWLFLRCNELLRQMEKEALEADERHGIAYEIEAALEKSLIRLQKSHTSGAFEFNDRQETWMDTSFNGDERAGIRVEIQALRLNMYRLMFELTLDQKFKALENILAMKVQENFWNGEILADGLNDFTVRPNIFIAAYAYQDMLKLDEWKSCFKTAFEKLWLDWGGICTIDKSSQLFFDYNTGEDNRSYHRGDSWFWLNNLSALVMHRIGRAEFKDKIQKIIYASTEEILWKGCIGCHSEISSAGKLDSNGCFNQAWSNAMFIEMIDEIFGKKRN